MAQPKVLMLGWEFPPLINGGLGIASHGIAQALAHRTALSLILPKVHPDFALANTQLIGLNQLNLKKTVTAELQRDFFNKVEEVYRVSVGLDPYYVAHEDKKDISIFSYSEKDKTESEEEIDPNPFQVSEDLYDHHVIDKVRFYTRHVLSMAEEKDFDIIHAHDWMTFPAALELKLATGKPLVLHVHSLDYDRGGPELKNWIYSLEKEVLQEADKIVAVSHYTASILREHYDVAADKIQAVYNGIEPREAYKKKKGFPEKLVLFLGRVTGQKGPEIFLEVAEKVYRRYPEVRFVMAGTGDKLKRLIEAGAYTEVGHRFHFTGFLDREQVADLLAMSDVYCMPSVSEPFGLSALEAAQFNIPMVLSSQSGVSEVMPGALTADHWDTDEMSEQIIDILTNESMGRLLVEQNKEALEGLTWDRAGEQLLKLYENILEEPSLKEV
ncbi:MAG TPA: glycosyltransferase family 1 protein [Cytophagales bacterium]|nr:glycosyltransferase family 1 protein [Cytophagales bacterium]HAA19803.1 glycosyltransferase family 1 protein [Cytophagales bacterium]HAP64231.1 glycosyltransferase family 1 protein [Cytophagales bacterium]